MFSFEFCYNHAVLKFLGIYQYISLVIGEDSAKIFFFYYILILACWFILAGMHQMCSIYLRFFIRCTAGKNTFYLQILKFNCDQKVRKKEPNNFD